MSNDITLEEAEELLLIDKHNLDDEVELQNTIASRVGQKMVEIKSLRDEAKAMWKKSEGIAANEIREKAVEDSVKRTDGQVVQLILLNEGYQVALDKYLRLEKEAALWKIKREDFVGRAFMVSEMCGLYASEYFSRESVSKSSKVSAARMRFRENMINERKGQRSRINKDD